jgi:proline iminopeptidase
VSETGWLTTDDGVQLWYRSLGSGTDTLVVPGAAADVDLDALATDRRVIFYDARNRGRSDRLTAASQLGFYREVDDLDAVRAYFGLERFAVFGWSYNAAVVAYYAMARPVRVSQMVLVSPIAGVGRDRADEPDRAAQRDRPRHPQGDPRAAWVPG